ncbi:MAG TPA: ATP-binding protein, partial [Jatrophihabitans sp.]|nr:ATP-binding protein [Jatrophihabitans sp.]
ADQRAALREIRRSCSALDAMIDTLLAAARTDLARTVARADLDAVLAQFATATAAPPVVTAKRTGLGVGVDADVVARILTPIVDNAVRFAGSRVCLDAHRVGSSVIVTVANDGPVLAPELAGRVFEPGFRAGPADRHDGVGLGLALALRLARAADGDLDVDTTAPMTTFRLVLPAG